MQQRPQGRLSLELPFFDGRCDFSCGFEPLRDGEHHESVEHALELLEMTVFSCFFVGFLEEEVVGLENLVRAVINAEVVDAAEVAENGTDPRVLGRQLALPDGIQRDDAVELEHVILSL